jgi:hypothetical protein
MARRRLVNTQPVRTICSSNDESPATTEPPTLPTKSRPRPDIEHDGDAPIHTHMQLGPPGRIRIAMPEWDGWHASPIFTHHAEISRSCDATTLSPRVRDLPSACTSAKVRRVSQTNHETSLGSRDQTVGHGDCSLADVSLC